VYYNGVIVMTLKLVHEEFHICCQDWYVIAAYGFWDIN